MSSVNNNEDDMYFSVNCVKNRNGPLFARDFHWEGKTQTIRELEDVERQALGELRNKKAADKELDDL
jgi:hypothetical protein